MPKLPQQSQRNNPGSLAPEPTPELLCYPGSQDGGLDNPDKRQRGPGGESSGFEDGDSGVDLKAFKGVETRSDGEWGVATVEGEESKIHSFTHSP